MEVINGYKIDNFINDNSGCSMWTFARKGTREFFIKRLLDPVYPMDDGTMSKELLDEKRKYCEEFEQKYRKLYNAVNRAGFGNLVRIEEFFRYDSKYYIVMEKVSSNPVSLEEISKISLNDKYLLVKTVAFAFWCLHDAGVIHFDVKPSNIFVKKTSGGRYTGKIIDFDTGMFKDDIIGEIELGGDLTYLAPETFLKMRGEDVKITEKIDIFALGLVFYQYFTGELPNFNIEEYEYYFGAALEGANIDIDATKIGDEMASLIRRMLDANPKNRPSAKEIVEYVNGISHEQVKSDIDITRTGVSSTFVSSKGSSRIIGMGSFGNESTTVLDSSVKTKEKKDEWFSTGGDL